MGKGSKKQGRQGSKGSKGARAEGQGRRGPRAEVAGTARSRPRRSPPTRSSPARPRRRPRRSGRRRPRPARTTPCSPSRGPDALRVGPGLHLADLDPRSTPGFTGDKADGEEVMGELQSRLGDLQERLFAESKGGGQRSVLLVIQGMDTSGKGGIMRHVVGAVDPQGVHITSFKAPSAEEQRHPFLWRIRQGLPPPGDDRGVRPQPLRGRAHRAGPRPRPAHDVVAPLRPDQRLRARASSTTARSSSR